VDILPEMSLLLLLLLLLLLSALINSDSEFTLKMDHVSLKGIRR